MKHILAAALAATLSLGAWAQTPAEPEAPLMIINLKNGTNQEIPLADINNVTFRLPSEEPPTPPEVKTTPYFTVPTDFSKNRILKVMHEGKKVAEVCSEYILSLDAVKTVIYPMGADGYADLTKGIMADNGASVAWNTADNTVTIGADATAPTTIYVGADGSFISGPEEDCEAAEATVEPDFLVDVRGNETKTYTTVKIGTQYWMAENLRATNYADGSAIIQLTSSDADLTAWKNNTTGACHLPGDDKQTTEVFGIFYNGYAVTNEAGLAPEGWEVPSIAQWNTMKTATNKKPAYIKATAGWPTGNDGTDQSGFSAIPTGYFTNIDGESSTVLTETWWWTSTSIYDALSKATVLGYARVTATGASWPITTESLANGHALTFGHVVRCVRKAK